MESAGCVPVWVSEYVCVRESERVSVCAWLHTHRRETEDVNNEKKQTRKNNAYPTDEEKAAALYLNLLSRWRECEPASSLRICLPKHCIYIFVFFVGQHTLSLPLWIFILRLLLLLLFLFVVALLLISSTSSVSSLDICVNVFPCLSFFLLFFIFFLFL